MNSKGKIFLFIVQQQCQIVIVRFPHISNFYFEPYTREDGKLVSKVKVEVEKALVNKEKKAKAVEDALVASQFRCNDGMADSSDSMHVIKNIW